MRVGACGERPVLVPCLLGGYAFQVDPYIGCEHHCQYCYALNEAETDWSEEVLIHQDIVAQLDRELAAVGTQPIYVGWESDPYQPAEESYRQTRAVLELLAESGCPVCTLSKSDLITRDIDLLQKMPGSSAGISLAFSDEEVRSQFELEAPTTVSRIQALRQLHEAGIETYALICPVIPHLTDVTALIERVSPHADKIWVYPLAVEGEDDRAWRNIEAILRHHHPRRRALVREIVFSQDHAYWMDLLQELEERYTGSGLDLRLEI
jgi:DNA repair photolyase